MGTNVPKTVSKVMLLSQECYTLVIPMTLPSLNTFLRIHWAERKRIKDEFTHCVWALCNEQRLPPVDCVHIDAAIYHSVKRKRDADNQEATLKKVAQDSLVRIGIIPDDTPEHVSWGEITLDIDKTFPRVVLTLMLC